MATQAAVLAKRKALNWMQTNTVALGPEARFLIQQLFQTLAQIRGNPDLEFVPLANTSTTDQVVLGAAGTLYALVLKGEASGGDFRSADHASSANSPTTTIPLAVGEILVHTTPAGKAFANGLTVDFSASNAGSGFAIVGA